MHIDVHTSVIVASSPFIALPHSPSKVQHQLARRMVRKTQLRQAKAKKNSPIIVLKFKGMI